MGLRQLRRSQVAPRAAGQGAEGEHAMGKEWGAYKARGNGGTAQ